MYGGPSCNLKMSQSKIITCSYINTVEHSLIYTPCSNHDYTVMLSKKEREDSNVDKQSESIII